MRTTMLTFKSFFSFLFFLAISIFPFCHTPLKAQIFTDEVPEELCVRKSLLPLSLIAGEAGLSVEHFRGIPDGSWEGNFGSVATLNLGMPLPFLSNYGFGFQIGGSFGVYDWSGRASSASSIKETQQQIFFTTGIFLRTPYCSGINTACVFDWMINKNYGVFALHPGISQIRFEGSYLFENCNEYGIWGTADIHTSHRSASGVPVKFKPLSQLNLFWRHFYANCGQTMIWVGAPYKKGLLAQGGRAGKFILGASFNVPLTYCLNVEGHATYMCPRSEESIVESRNYASNVSIGLVYTFGGPRCCNDNRDIRPYLPVANNSNFLVDSNTNF